MTKKLYIVIFVMLTGLLSAQNSLIRMPKISPNAQ